MAKTNPFGAKIKSFRIKHLITQQEFADHVGVSVPSVRRFETQAKYEGSEMLREKITRGMKKPPLRRAA